MLEITRLPDDTPDWPEVGPNAPSQLYTEPTPVVINTGSDDKVQYEIEAPDGRKTVVDTSMQGAGNQPPDPVRLARTRLNQLRMVRRLIKTKKREMKLAERSRRKVAKRRKKRDLERASRKRNRG
jgi:hypothetical protein